MYIYIILSKVTKQLERKHKHVQDILSKISAVLKGLKLMSHIFFKV